MSIGIIGAGAFGTALAVALSANDDILLWGATPTRSKRSSRLAAMSATCRDLIYRTGSGQPRSLTIWQRWT